MKAGYNSGFWPGNSLGKVIDCVSKINTGAKYDSKVFKKAVGLNGVGSKAVNAFLLILYAIDTGWKD